MSKVVAFKKKKKKKIIYIYIYIRRVIKEENKVRMENDNKELGSL